MLYGNNLVEFGNQLYEWMGCCVITAGVRNQNLKRQTIKWSVLSGQSWNKLVIGLKPQSYICDKIKNKTIIPTCSDQLFIFFSRCCFRISQNGSIIEVRPFFLLFEVEF
jgi:hypothetical protein